MDFLSYSKSSPATKKSAVAQDVDSGEEEKDLPIEEEMQDGDEEDKDLLHFHSHNDIVSYLILFW